MSIEVGIQSFILVLIILLILVGNGLVIASVASCRRLRTVTNLFAVSLAVADLAVALLVLPLSVIYLAQPPWVGWPFGQTTCRFWLSFDVSCCTASLMHLGLISFDRYVAITDPLRYRIRMSRSKALAYIGCAWCLSLAISFVPIFLNWFSDDVAMLSGAGDVIVVPPNATQTTTGFRFEPDTTTDGQSFANLSEAERNQTTPEIPYCTLTPNKVYAVVTSGTAFYVPLTVMVISYSNIYRIAKRQREIIIQTSRRSDEASARSNLSWKGIFSISLLTGIFRTRSMRNNTVHCSTETASVDFYLTDQVEDASVDVTHDAAAIGRRMSASLNDVSSFVGSEMEGGRERRDEETTERNPQMLKVESLTRSHTAQSLDLVQSWKRRAVASKGQGKRRSRQQNDHKAFKTLGVLMGLFFICWLPFFVMYVSLPFCQLRFCLDFPRWAVDAITWLGYSNSLFNPCVYALTNKDFKEAYWNLVRFKRCSF